MSIETLISKLERVKPNGKNKWLACCPAHNDKSPSLSIKELDDGRVLIHCFAGCDVHSVLNAVSLDISTLFPENSHAAYKSERKPFPAMDVLLTLWREILIVAIAGELILKGMLPDADRQRLAQAVSRIRAGLDAAGVNHA